MGVPLELQQRLEENAVAEIYVAQHQGRKEKYFLRRLRRTVAERPEAREALEATSRVVAGLRGELLLPHAFFEAEGVSATWADAWVEGIGLTVALQRLGARETRLSPPAVLLLFEDVCHSLAVLHGGGVSFGLLCPEHIVLGRDGRARLAAAGFESALLGVKALASQQLRGRRQHLPPEIPRGRPASPAGDVYAAASLAYLFLTGHPATSGEESTVSTRHQAVVPPSHACRSLPFACDAVFLKALSANPSARPQTGDELSEAFRKLRAALVSGKDNSREELSQLATSLLANELRFSDRKPSVAAKPPPPPPAPPPPEPEELQPSAPPAPEPTAALVQSLPEGSAPPAPELFSEDTPTDQVPVQLPSTESHPRMQATHDTQEMPQAPAAPEPPVREPRPAAQPPAACAQPSRAAAAPVRLVRWPVLLVALAAEALLGWWLLKPAEKLPSPPAEQTSIGFLTVNASQPLQVLVDGQPVGVTPLERRLLPAGKHRVSVRASGGQPLLDQEIILRPGEHQNLQVVEPVVPPNVEPPPVPKPTPKVVKKKTARRGRR